MYKLNYMKKFHTPLILNMGTPAEPDPKEVDLYYSEDDGKAGLWHSRKPLPNIGDRIKRNYSYVNEEDYEAVVLSYLFEAGWIMLQVFVPATQKKEIFFGIDLA